MSFFDRLSQRLSQLVDDMAIPDAVREDLLRGQAALQAGAPAQAQLCFERVTRAAPEHARAWQLLGLSQLRQGLAAAAALSLERAHALAPDSFEMLLALAEAQRAAGKEEAALVSYKRSLGGKVDEQLLERVYRGLGEIYLRHGQADRAMRELRKAVALVEGRDPQLFGLLGLAQLAAGERLLARESLTRAAAVQPPDREVLLGLSQVLLELGEPAQARLALQRLLGEQPRDAAARCALARCLLELGEPERARQELLHALEAEPALFAAHSLLAETYLSAHDPLTALVHLRHARALPAPSAAEQAAVLRRIVDVSLDLSFSSAELESDARALLAVAPEDPVGLAGLALACPSPAAPALALLQRALAQQESYAARLAEGMVHLEAAAAGTESALERAATALRAALRRAPARPRARTLLEQVYQRLAGGPLGAGPLPFYSALGRLQRLLLAQPAFVEWGTEVARIQEVFDRPLLVTVMGEFNSGKSTFVNALLGAKVAPMGVTPTTATINVLKYGERRGARVLWRDDHEDLLAWEGVGPFLVGLDREQAQRIRLVEILYPAEELLRVNVVDTPGLNSLFEEHEATAREYMRQADAVIWLFAAGQAGKQSEEQALELLGQYRLKTVGVLNKVDQLSERELEQVLAHLQREFAALVELVIPLSAREALEARAAGALEEQRLAASRFPELRRVLEEQLFARSRRIKREVCEQRLALVLGHVLERGSQNLAAADQASATLDELRQLVHKERLLDEERVRVREALQQAYRRGAAEVLDFVRPRRWVLGEHRATLADRDFLLELLLEELTKLGEDSAARVSQELEQLHRELAEGLERALQGEALGSLRHYRATLDQLVRERLALLRQQVYTRHQAFARGYLRGGRVDVFFEQRLPRLALELEAIHSALLADSVDVEEELLQPLGQWLEGTLALVRELLAGLRQEIELLRLEQDGRVLAPVLALERALREGGELS